MKRICFFLVVIGFSLSLHSNSKFAWRNNAQHIYGPTVNAKHFKGKVVFVEFWGINCPPCIAMMPHVEQMNRKYGGSGKFAVVASHVQGMNPRVKQYLKSKKFTFPVYQQFMPSGPNFRGIPHAYVYDHNGKLVGSGYPSK